jgi:hypothetical protein
MLALRSIAAPVQRQCYRAAPRAAVTLSLQVRQIAARSPRTPRHPADNCVSLPEPKAVLVAGSRC